MPEPVDAILYELRVMLLGYARVSTSDQSLAGQLDALNAAGCERVWTDVASGAPTRRLGLDDLIAAAAAGDTVVTTRLDRLGRSLPHLLDRVQKLSDGSVGLRSLAEEIDTSSATGRLMLHVFGALAEFERGINYERTMAGLAAARARGRVDGRPRALIGRRLAHARELAAAGVPAAGFQAGQFPNGVISITLCQKSFAPLVERYGGEPEHPAGHRDGHTVSGKVKDQREHQFGLTSRLR